MASSKRASKKPAPPQEDELDDPFILCGVAALVDALRIINERDREFQMKLLDGAAIERFVLARRDGLLSYHFPGWKSRRMKRNEKRLASAQSS